jgi:hypothetical protein
MRAKALVAVAVVSFALVSCAAAGPPITPAVVPYHGWTGEQFRRAIWDTMLHGVPANAALCVMDATARRYTFQQYSDAESSAFSLAMLPECLGTVQGP